MCAFYLPQTHSPRVEIRVFPYVINANVRKRGDKANKWPETEKMKTETEWNSD